MRHLFHAAALCLGCVIAWLPAPLRADTPAGDLVIPPGQEQVVARLLTPDAKWSGELQLQRAEVEQAAMTARYQGPGCELTVRLQHPSAAPQAALRTSQFALTVVTSACDAARVTSVTAALQAQIARVEADFRWVAAAAALPKAATPTESTTVRQVDQLAKWLDQGAAALRSGERQRATALLQQVVTAVPQLAVQEQPDAWAGVAALARALGDPATATYAAKALQGADQGGAGAEIAVARLRALLAAGRTEEGLRAVDAVAADRALHKQACTLASRAASDLELAGQPQQGLDLLRRWQTADPDCAELALAASRLARRAGLGPSVLGQLEEAVRRHPRHVPLAIHLAHLYKELKRYPEALSLVDRIDFKGVTLDKALVLDITRVYLDSLDNQASLALQRSRADANPPDVVAAFIVGTILHHTGHWQASNDYLARSQQAFAAEPRQFIYTGMNHFRLGHQAEGERLIEEALRLGSSDPDIYYCRAVIWSYKDPRKAAADLQTYLKMTAGSHETYAPKEAKVSKMLADLQTCQDARDVQECLQTQSFLHDVRQRAPWVVGLLAVAICLLLLWKRRRLASVATMLTVGLLLCAPPQASAQVPATLQDLLHASPPVWAQGWQEAPLQVAKDRIVVTLHHAQHGTLQALLVARGTLEHPWLQTASYDLAPASAQQPTESARQQLQLLHAWIHQHDRGQYRLAAPAAPARPQGDIRPTLATPTSWAAQWTWLDNLGRVQLMLGLVLLGGSLLFFPALGRLVYAALCALPTGERRAVWGLLALGVGLRLAVPVHFVMLGSVYRLVEDAAALTHVPRPGLSPTLLYRLVFDWAAPGHDTLAAVNTVCALLTLPVPIALVARWRPPPYAAAVLAGLAALTPVLVVDARTESHLLPAMLWLWSGLFLLDVALTDGRRSLLLAAALLLTNAAWSRPELTAMVPLLAAAVVWYRGQLQTFAINKLSLSLAGLGWLVLQAPQVLHLQRASAIEQAAGSIPQLNADFFLQVPSRWLSLSLPLQADLFPLGVTLLALLSAIGPCAGLPVSTRRLLRALLVLAAVWMALTLVDLPRTSVPRLHAPAALLLALAAAYRVAATWQHRPHWRPWMAAALILVVISGVPSAGTLLARTNEDDNAEWVDAAMQRLPAHDACLVALGMGDGPSGHKTQRALPDYLLRPPHRDARRYTIDDWQRSGQPRCAAGTFLLVDQRCYALHRDTRKVLGAPASGLIAPCREVLASAPWQAVVQHDLPNRGDNEYGYYGDQPSFAVALYQLPASSPGSSGG